MKRVLWIFGGIVVALALLVLAVVHLTPSETIAQYAKEAAKDATGRDLVIDGPIERRLFPSPRIELGAVSFANAEWAEDADKPMVSAQGAVVEISLGTFFGAPRLEEFRLVKPEIRLEVAKDGRANWDFGGASEAVSDNEEHERGDHEIELNLSIVEAQIEDGLFIFHNRQNGQEIVLEDVDVALRAPDLNEGLSLTGGASWNKARVALEGEIGAPAGAAAGEPTDAKFAITGPGLGLSFDGAFQNADDAPIASGDFEVALSADRAETQWLRSSLPPQLGDLGEIDLKGAFDAKPAALSFETSGGLSFKGQRTDLTASANGGAGWMGGSKPIDVKLSAQNPLMDVRYDGLVGRTAAEAPMAKGKFRAKIDDVQRALAWAVATQEADSPLAKLKRVNLRGDIDLSDARASAVLNGGVNYNKREVLIDANIDGPKGWDSGAPVTIALGANARDFFEAAWDGTVAAGDEGVSADGQALFAAPKFRNFLVWAGAGPIDAPQDALKSVRVATNVKVSPTQAALTELDANIGEARLQGDVVADLSGARPSADVKLVSGVLDLRPFLAAAKTNEPSASSNGAAKSGEWSDEPIDFGPLRAADATIDILADGLITDTVRLQRTKITGALKDGLLNLNFEELALYQGGAKGAVKLNAGAQTPALDFDMTIDAVRLSPLLKDLADFSNLEGLGSVKLDLASEGRSMKALMSALDGDGAIDLQDGAILGVNLAAMVRNAASAFLDPQAGEARKTDFAELSGTFKITDGVLSNLDMQLLSPLLRIVGEGEVDLGRQQINYRITPKAVASISGQGGQSDLGGLSFPVVISGPWSNPSFAPDLSGGIQGLIENPEAAIEQIGGAVEQLKDGGLGGALGGALKGALSGGDAKDAQADAPAKPEKKPSPEDLLRGVLGR